MIERHDLLRPGLALLLIAAIAVALVYRDHIDVQALQRLVVDPGPWVILLFIAGYAIAPILLLPGTVLTVFAGAVFGPIRGSLYALVGTTIGATLAFLIARYLAGDWVARKTRGRLRRVINGVEDQGWRFVAFTRLAVVFPYNLLNYALGLTRIRLSHYIVTSFICMAPIIFAYGWIGHIGRAALSGEQQALIRNGLIALALIATVLFMPGVIKRLRKRPEHEQPENRPIDHGESNDDR